MSGTEVELPYDFDPRWYQEPAWKAFDEGFKRLLLVHHRRAGKDVNCINFCARATQMRVGTYFYFLPTFAQARRVIWDGMTGDGRRFLSYIPEELWADKPNETNMRIRLKNGSVFQLVGSDRIDNIVGTNPVGCVFSEYSLQDPRGWDFIRPILRENGGWALFNGTPRGKANHMYHLHEMAKKNPEWFTDLAGVDKTKVLSEEDVQAERDAGMTEELIQQEFYCSFDGGMEGAIYVEAILKMQQEDRVCNVPHLDDLPVHTAWDIGLDTTAIIFFQTPQGGAIHVIDYYESSQVPLPHYVRVLADMREARGFNYGYHVMPWDIKRKEWDDGQGRESAARKLGLNVQTAKRMNKEDGINAVHMLLPRMMIDTKHCERLVQALLAYRRKQDRISKEFMPTTVHDWSSHPCDALRTLATGRKRGKLLETQRRERYTSKTSRASSGSWMSA